MSKYRSTRKRPPKRDSAALVVALKRSRSKRRGILTALYPAGEDRERGGIQDSLYPAGEDRKRGISNLD